VSWIRSVPRDEAAPPLRDIYDRIAARSHGQVASLWLALGLDPRGLETCYTHYRVLIDDPSPLSASQTLLIALVVSATNGCGYAVTHLGPRLATSLGDEALARAVARDYREANLAARDRVLLDYAVALTCEPAERTRDDVERVREYGLDDVAILKATELAAFTNHMNRLISALGIELEPDITPWEFGSQR
jgi:uncharacterized peroxidase-related enzyme